MANVTPIKKLLVANRGEIARRIMRTAHDMGISTVAIFAEGDARAPFVNEADTAIFLEGRTSTETYLDVEKVINACKRSGADAVHPGYGFLSENEGFAQAIIDAGIKWIGPSPKVIGLMGDKLSAKNLMTEAGVPTLPAIEITDSVDVLKAADEIGYPVLVKASAGGGGRGMRIVETKEDLEAAVEGAKREALNSFGDDTVFLEKWLDVSRHVEIQILGDTHGNLVHCFERECSIQRRHQKVIEEAPSPAVTEDIRERMGAAAIAAAKKLGYSSAGTVEFLLSGDEFWFLEVNARLQVEHPVTEEIIGKDLVREQIRVAEGEALSFNQEELSINGHAIEARLYAENPEKNFLPSPGPVIAWEPSTIGRARFDSGVETGSIITTEFDPMIAKVTVHAPTRREAAARLARVLETTRIQGLTTNRDFLVNTLRTDEYIAGDTTTDFIERVNPDRVIPKDQEALQSAAIAIAIESQAKRRAHAKINKRIRGGWRNSTMPNEELTLEAYGEEIKLNYKSNRDNSFNFSFEETSHVVKVINSGHGSVEIDKDGQRSQYTLDKIGDEWLVHSTFCDFEFRELPRYPISSSDDFGGGLVAPMPGAILSIDIKPGDSVKKGDVLVILEAMKMEHRITAPRDGIVGSVQAEVGEQVENEQLLVTLEDEEGE
ncbi:MAG: carbamoyl-phosphate synthase L chain ATP-binding protein [Gammaproteobacteria bacterium]|nr:carbamoyl-phosphate synthase L chain ATP-binding protein [Gammaproteobacteria bacterium]